MIDIIIQLIADALGERRERKQREEASEAMQRRAELRRRMQNDRRQQPQQADDIRQQVHTSPVVFEETSATPEPAGQASAAPAPAPAPQPPSKQQPRAHRTHRSALARKLHTHKGLREAVLLREILDQPLALRDGHR